MTSVVGGGYFLWSHDLGDCLILAELIAMGDHHVYENPASPGPTGLCPVHRVSAWRFFTMTTPPFLCLTLEHIHEFLNAAASDGSIVDVVCGMSNEAKNELYGLALYGQSCNEFDYQWHLEHITEGGHRCDLSVSDVRSGLQKLGLDDTPADVKAE